MPLVGAPGEVKEPDEAVHSLVTTLKAEVEAKTGQTFEEFVPVKYRSQLVNGVNYFIKVRHGPNQHLHLRAHKTFDGKHSLAAVQLDKTLEEDLAYFQ